MLASLTACEDYNDQFNLGSQISDVKKGVAIKLAAADYATVANNATNKEIALSKDPEKGTYVAALEAIGKNRYFADKTEAEWFLPAFITEKYPQADAGSRFSVSYNMYKAPSTYLADFKNLKEYTLSNADYKKVWAETATATYLSPSTMKKLPEVLAGEQQVYGTVAVIGGGMVGCETAEYLAARGCKVSVIEMMDKIAAGESTTILPTLLENYKTYGVEQYPSHKVKEFRMDAVVCENKDGAEVTIPCDYIVLAMGARSNEFDAAALEAANIPVYSIGDAAGKAADISNAIRTGYDTACQL